MFYVWLMKLRYFLKFVSFVERLNIYWIRNYFTESYIYILYMSVLGVLMYYRFHDGIAKSIRFLSWWNFACRAWNMCCDISWRFVAGGWRDRIRLPHHLKYVVRVTNHNGCIFCWKYTWKRAKCFIKTTHCNWIFWNTFHAIIPEYVKIFKI